MILILFLIYNLLLRDFVFQHTFPLSSFRSIPMNFIGLVTAAGFPLPRPPLPLRLFPPRPAFRLLELDMFSWLFYSICCNSSILNYQSIYITVCLKRRCFSSLMNLKLFILLFPITFVLNKTVSLMLHVFIRIAD